MSREDAKILIKHYIQPLLDYGFNIIHTIDVDHRSFRELQLISGRRTYIFLVHLISEPSPYIIIRNDRRDNEPAWRIDLANPNSEKKWERIIEKVLSSI